MILTAITLTDLTVVLLFYLIGWLGSFLLLATTVFALSTIWRMYRYSDVPNHNRFIKGLMDYYRWLDIDWAEGPEIYAARIPFSVVAIMAIFASLGTLSFSFAFGFAIVIAIVLLIWVLVKFFNDKTSEKSSEQ